MIHNMSSDNAGFLAYKAANEGMYFVFADLQGATNDDKAQDLQDSIQDYLDDKVPIADLGDDDPDKTTDPALPTIFWDGDDLVSRSDLVSVIYNNGYEISIQTL